MPQQNGLKEVQKGCLSTYLSGIERVDRGRLKVDVLFRCSPGLRRTEAHQKNRLLQSEFLHATFDDAGAEGDNSRLKPLLRINLSAAYIIRTISIAPQKDSCREGIIVRLDVYDCKNWYLSLLNQRHSVQ